MLPAAVRFPGRDYAREDGVYVRNIRPGDRGVTSRRVFGIAFRGRGVCPHRRHGLVSHGLVNPSSTFPVTALTTAFMWVHGVPSPPPGLSAFG